MTRDFSAPPAASPSAAVLTAVPSDLVTREQAAQEMGVTPRTISRYRAAGTLTAYTSGRRVRYSLAEVKRLRDRQASFHPE